MGKHKLCSCIIFLEPGHVTGSEDQDRGNEKCMSDQDQGRGNGDRDPMNVIKIAGIEPQKQKWTKTTGCILFLKYLFIFHSNLSVLKILCNSIFKKTFQFE